MVTKRKKPKKRGPVSEELIKFLLAKNRFPHLTDEKKPWTYRGWLLIYVQEANHSHPAVPDRWGYLAEIHSSKKLPSRPIPTIHFQHVGEGEGPRVQSNIKQCIGALERHGFWSSFWFFVDWLSFALGLDDEPPQEINEEENEKLYRLCNLGPWMLNPSDHLGHFLSQETGKGWNPNAFYPTPHNVVEMMARMTFHDIEGRGIKQGKDPRVMSLCDPCVGTGRMLMHASNFTLNLYGQDVDPFVLKITKINGALYAPWIVYKPPQEVVESTEIADWQVQLF